MERRGVRLRLLMVAVVTLATLPIFALHLARLQSNSDQALRQAYADGSALAAAGAEAHENATTQAKQLLEVLSRIPSVRSATLPSCESILQSIQDSREWLTGIFVVDADGKGVCGGGPVVRTLDVRDRKYFRDAKASGRYGISDVITSHVTKDPIVIAVLPLHDHDGEFRAALGVGISLSWMNRVAAEAHAKFDGLLIVADGAGAVIAYEPDMPHGWSLARLSDTPEIKDIFSSDGPTFETADPAGVQRLFSVARVPDSGLMVAVGLDRAEVLGPIEAAFRRDLMFLLLVSAISVGLGLLAAEFGLLRGVRALKTAAQRLKAGKMGLRVHLPSFVATELHDLAATYNAMTAEFERLAYLDRLTGLPNRRYLERHLARREGRGAKGTPAHNAVLAIDIDGFKPVNDSHGHAIGDRVLAIIARRIAGAIDERGLLFRVGGDEFVAVIPLAKTHGRDIARTIGEEVRQAMEQPIEFEDLSFPVACSVGIAVVPEDAATLSKALGIADAALYEAKRSGRNRVVDIAPPTAAGMPGYDPRRPQLSPLPMEFGAPH